MGISSSGGTGWYMRGVSHKYANHISSSPLADDLAELVGKRLLSDVTADKPCTSDILIAMVYYAWANGLLDAQKDNQWIHGGKGAYPRSKWSRKALCVMAATTGDAWGAIFNERKIWARQPPLLLDHHSRWHQQTLTETFASYFPDEVFDGFSFPYVEDLVNLPAFNRYAEWAEQRSKPPGRSSPPSHVEKVASQARGAEGVQMRAFSHRAALPPIVSFGLDPDQHFDRSMRLADGILPSEKAIMMDEDLKFAAFMMVSSKNDLYKLRNETIQAVRQLKHRWRTVTAKLRSVQQTNLRQVTKTRDIGLLTLLSIIMLWPDFTFGEHLVYGFPAVGHCEWSGIWPQREVTSSQIADPFAGASDHNKTILRAMRPGKDDHVILEKSLEDARKGFATMPLTQHELDVELKGKEFRLIRRFVITQSTGKQRIIDDAAAGGQSEASTDENILGFCNALQPAHHLATLVAELEEKDMQWPHGEGIKSGGEDWPDAYRYTPMRPEEARACVVVWWHREKKKPVFQLYHGLLFGLPNAVTSFNRWSKLSQALVRRLLYVLFSMYFDDATMQDWSSEANHSQSCVADLMTLLGSPWSPSKTQTSSQEGDFLGLLHDVSRAEEGLVSFWPRESLVIKVLNIISIAKEVGLPPGVASKLYGVANFMETGMFARIGRAGLWAIKERQKEGSFDLTPSITQSFQLLTDLFRLKPRREFLFWDKQPRRSITASDAAYENGVGSAGFLSVIDPGHPEETRVGRVIALPPSLYKHWGPQTNYIAQLELLAVLTAITQVAGLIRGTSSIWFVDNIAALMALVKGSSGSHSLDQMAKIVHLACFAVRTTPYFEYVESKANWSDEISRKGTRGKWASRNSFAVGKCDVLVELLSLPCIAIVIIFEHL